MDFNPRFVVLSAGVGNSGLLAKLGADTNAVPANTPVQAQRKNHMMVLRGDHLPMMTAVFPIRGGLQGVFLCPRTDPVTGQPVWLVSDHNSLPFQMTPDGNSPIDSTPSEEWVRRMLISLRATTPAVFTDGAADSLELAIYTGLTSERNFGVGQHMTDLYIDPLGFENALAIWPTKLTMTPFASNVALRFIRPKVPEPAGEWPRVERAVTAPSPDLASEMWSKGALETAHEYKTAWAPYSEFSDRWKVRGVAGR